MAQSFDVLAKRGADAEIQLYHGTGRVFVHELVERGPQLMRPEDVSIRTRRLDLRRMEPDDAQAAFETYTSDPLAAKYMTFTTQSTMPR